VDGFGRIDPIRPLPRRANPIVAGLAKTIEHLTVFAGLAILVIGIHRGFDGLASK
jgi:hypothetical protein